MIKIFIILCLSLSLLFPTMYANASPRNAELVLDNIQIEPPYPEKGELVTITGDVYGAGIVDTDSLASIISAAYFVDGELLYIDEIGNVEPGIGNKIKISSTPIWGAELGNHVIKIIIDYHDTLNDEYDLPDDNLEEKTFFIQPRDSMKIILNSSPQYIVQGKDVLLKINTSLVDSDSNKPLNNKKIIFNFDGDDVRLTTDKDGNASFSKMVNSFEAFNTEVYFEGDDQYLPSDHSLTILSIPKEVTTAIIMKINDMEKLPKIQDHSFELLIFQDSYENLIERVSPNTALLDSDTFWISLPPDHDYFVEVYLDGRFLFLTDKKQLNENSIVLEELTIPDPAEIQFRIINEIGEPQSNVTVNNWIYSSTSDEDGFTSWMEVLPIFTANEPYVAEIILSDQKTIKSIPFLVFSGERKTIDIIINEFQKNPEIPNWIRNNAGWWANEQIDDQSFIEGIQFLIKENILQIPLTQNGSSVSNEIPNWIRNNAGWWANEQIDDQSFIEGIQFLIKEGIMKIQ